MMLNNQEIAEKAITEAKEYRKKRQYEQALAACDRAIKADANAIDAYGIRWAALREVMNPNELRVTINREVEAFLDAQPETPEVLNTAYWGYMNIPGRTQNVPQSLFDKMLQHPGTGAMLSALDGLAERSDHPCEKWKYKQRIIDEFDAETVTQLSWYVMSHQQMLRLAEKDRSLASDGYLDELINRGLQAHLAYCRYSKQWHGWAYRESVDSRLKLNIRLDKALETIERAEEKEEQEWLVEHNDYSVEEAQKDFLRLRGQIYLKQERWSDAYQVLKATTLLYPDYLTSLSTRFSNYRLERFWLLGRALEGIGEFDQALRYYIDVHFGPNPQPEACAGLERIYQTQHGSPDGFEDFLKTAETEYREREAEEREIIRKNLIKEKLDKEPIDFNFQTLDGKAIMLSEMRGKVVLFDVWASWCHWCKRAIPEVQKVYDHFRTADDVVICGINDGEYPEKVRSYLEEHQPPWQILLDPEREVRKVFEIQGIPTFVVIDKAGDGQYIRHGYSEWAGQELIWFIESLRTT